MIDFKKVREMIRIEIETGRAVIPERDDSDKPTRAYNPDNFNDYCEREKIIRRLAVVDAMNTLIRLANNENIADGYWLACGVADGDLGLALYEYIDDETFYEISEVFLDIIKNDVTEVDDLVY